MSLLAFIVVKAGFFEKQTTDLTISSTNELSALFANALVLGVETVNLSEVTSYGTITPELASNAYNEALLQNPYTIGAPLRLESFDEATKIATISYHFSNRKRIKKQNDSQRKIRKIVKEHAPSHMTPLEKASALNDYLCQTITYNYGAVDFGDGWNGRTFIYGDAWNLYGAVKKHNVVCMGYAYAYKALMDEVGIPCVVVTGDAGGSHAWNKIFIDGKWRVVDVTWNDQDKKPNQYFFITDAENDDHTQDNNFVLSIYAQNYKTD